MLAQRIYGLALGYEDLNDHEKLRSDPLLGVLSGKRELEEPLAGKSTLNRLELAGRTPRYYKISYSADAIDQAAGGHLSGVAGHGAGADRAQSGCHRHSHLRPSVGALLPRLLRQLLLSAPVHVCRRSTDQLLGVRLRPANQDGAAGSLEEVQRLVAQIRRRWPTVKIVLRGDSGFCREELTAWCQRDENRVDYLFGLARNRRLTRIIGAQMHQAHLLHQTTGNPPPPHRPHPHTYAQHALSAIQHPKQSVRARYAG